MATKNSQTSCCAELEGIIEPNFFKALGDPNRVALFCRLARCKRPCTVTELGECCAVDISVVSRHLGVLRDAGVAQAEKRGKEVYYSVSCRTLAKKLREMARAIETCSGG